MTAQTAPHTPPTSERYLKRRAYLLEQIAAGNVHVNKFDTGITATLSDPDLPYNIDGKVLRMDITDLVNEGLVRRPRFTSYGRPAALTPKGLAEAGQ